MKSWKPARILYLVLAIMLTFSVIPFIPFSINMTLATEEALTTFNIIFFLYDAIGLLIALTILSRVRRDNYRPTGALLGFMTYALALLGHFLFYRYGQETLYFSHFFQSPVADQLFRFIVIIAVLTWLFNVMALIMSYIEVFDIRNAARASKKAQSHKITETQKKEEHPHKQVRKVDDYKNIDPKDHVVQQPDVSQEHEAEKAETSQNNKQVKETADQLRQDAVVSKKAQDGEEELDIIIEGVNLSQIAVTTQGIAIDADAVDAEGEASTRRATRTKKAAVTRANNADVSGHGGHGSNGYIAQLTGDLFMDDSANDKKIKRRKTGMKTTEKREKKIKPITADMLDNLDDDE